jgi:hypothetical protein
MRRPRLSHPNIFNEYTFDSGALMSFNMKFFMLSAVVIALASVTSGCSSSPMKDRLDRNMVYQCSLQLLEKNVPASDAERICSSSHNAEMEEKRFSAAMRSGHPVPPAAVSRVPASAPAPTGAADAHPSVSRGPALESEVSPTD